MFSKGVRNSPTHFPGSYRCAVLLLLAGGALAAACGKREREEAPPRAPNVLFVVMDTVRADHCSFLGYERETTPRLDSFARDAVAYEQAWASSGWTGPSHATMFTGLEPEQHGVMFGNRLWLTPESVTLAERLQEVGYETVGISSNGVVGPRFCLDQGFGVWHPVYADPQSSHVSFYRTIHDEITRLQTLDRPWFVFVNDNNAHLPYTPGSKDRRDLLPPDATVEEIDTGMLFDAGEAADLMVGLRGATPRERELLKGLYDAEIHSVDEHLGRLLRRLADLRVLDDTVVIITADHGENLGEHGLWNHVFSLHRSVCRVPLLVRYPPRLKGGVRVTDVVRLEDLYPTVLELCGLPVEEGLPGISLLESGPGRIARARYGVQDPWTVMEKSKRQRADADTSIFRDDLRAAFDGRYHLIRHAEGDEELYDIPADPDEANDLLPGATGLEEVLRQLRKHL